jgi:hypothetical protein
MRTITISCDTCRMQDTAACVDCVVTHLCERDPTQPVMLGVAERRALHLLASAGLVPELRHQRGRR